MGLFHRNLDYWTYFFFGEPGLGSLHGGFGLVFWGLGVPSFLFLLIKTMRTFRHPVPQNFPRGWWQDTPQGERDYFALFFLGQLVLGLAALFYYAVSVDLLSRSGRLILYVGGLGLVALAVVWPRLTKVLAGTGPFLKVLCIGGSLLALIQIGDYRLPMYDLRKPLTDRISGESPSPFKYLFLGSILEPLDLMTREGQGINLYVAGPYTYFFTTHFYGLKLQNRIWNFASDPSGEPDGFVFFHHAYDRKLYYLGKRIAPEEVMNDSRYILITQEENGLFFLNQSLLDQPQRKKALMEYYHRVSKESLPLARQISSGLDPEGIILSGSSLGYAFRYLDLAEEIPNHVRLVPKGSEVLMGRRLQDKIIYTVGSALKGFQSKEVFEIPLGQERFSVFKNEWKD